MAFPEIETREQTTAEIRTPPETSPAGVGSGRFTVASGLLLIFLLGFALRYWYCFQFPHIRDYSAGDAWGFLRNAEALTNLHKLPPVFWQECWQHLLGQSSPSTAAHIREVLSPLRDFPNSGPMFPLYLACTYVVAGTPFDIQNWGPPTFVQCIVSSLIGVFVALTGNCMFNRTTGFLAGILCALYPAFVINSDRMYSEIFAAFLLSCVCFLTASSLLKPQTTVRSFSTAFLNGLAATCLQYTRGTMCVLTLMLMPITIFQRGRGNRKLAISAFLLAIAITVIPWLCLQKVAFKSSSLIFDRDWQFNYFVGNCVDTAGWLSFPYRDAEGIKQKSLPRLMIDCFRRSPSRWLKLTQDKPLRMFKLPWNDFRKPLGPLSFYDQALMHQALLLLSVIGMILGFVAYRKQEWRRNYTAQVFLLSVVLINCIYLLFIALPRYNLMAMPVLLLYAAVGIDGIFTLARMRHGLGISVNLSLAAAILYFLVRWNPSPWVAQAAGTHCLAVSIGLHVMATASATVWLAISLWRSVSLLSRHCSSPVSTPRITAQALLCALLIFSVPELILPADANGRAGEWHARIAPGQSISQNFTIPRQCAGTARQRQLYLLVDSNSLDELQSVEVKVNGQVVDAPFVPSISLVDDFSHFQNLPNGFMRESEWIFSCLTYQAGIVPAELRQWFVLPLPNSPGENGPSVHVELTNKGQVDATTIYGAFDDGSSLISIPSLSVYSWEKPFYGVESDSGFSDTRFNTKIAACSSLTDRHDLSDEPGWQSGRFNIHLLAGPQDTADQAIHPNTPKLQIEHLADRPMEAITIHDSSAHQRATIDKLPSYAPGDWWLVRLKAQARRSAGTGQLSATFNVNFVPKSDAPTGNISFNRKWGDPSITRPNTNSPYRSPRNGHITLSPSWQKLDVAIPLVPSSFGAPLKEIVCDFDVLAQNTDGTNSGGNVTELRDIEMQIIRLPKNPLDPGQEIY